MSQTEEIVAEVKKLRTRIKGLEEKASKGIDVEEHLKLLNERLDSLEEKAKGKGESVDFGEELDFGED